MTVLNLADALKLGSTDVDKVMLGSTEVWAPGAGGSPYFEEVMVDNPLFYARMGAESTVTVAASLASSEYGNGEIASAAFDGSATTYWTTAVSNMPAWLRAQLSVASVATTYSMHPRDDIITRNPSAWTFEGSNDGSTWTVLDTQSGITWSSGQIRTFPISNTTAYLYYRINVTANNGDGYLSIAELMSDAWAQSTGSALTDSSGNNRNGLYSGAVTLDVPGLLTGDPDAAADFAGGRAQVPYAAWMAPAAWSLSFLFKADTLGAQQRALVSRHSSFNTSWDVITENGLLKFRVPQWTEISHAITTGTVYHVGCSWDGTTRRLYVDGVERASSTLAPSGSSAPLAIGQLGDSFAGAAYGHDGVIDEVAFFGSALSAARFAAQAAVA